MGYQVGDAVNGPFGDIYETMAEAEKALAECIAEGEAWNLENLGQLAGSDGETADSFFFIVDSTGGEI
jgi:hypothetical protein